MTKLILLFSKINFSSLNFKNVKIENNLLYSRSIKIQAVKPGGLPTTQCPSARMVGGKLSIIINTVISIGDSLL